jgi:plasmid maintenance system antidote protein VapI
MSAEFWMRLQMDFDLESAADAEEAEIHQTIRPRATKAAIENEEQRQVA